MDDGALQTVFSYGANLDPVRLAARCPGATGRRAGRLPDHRLVFDQIALERDGTGTANVQKAKGEVVEGALFEVPREELEARLDRFEGHPGHRSRRLMAVEEADGERTVAWVYFATPETRAPGLTPRADQLQDLLAGADLLSASYVARLEGLARAASAGPPG